MNAATIAAAGIGAALGGVARYVIGFWFLQRFGPGFPWGTLFINLTGSFLIAVVAELAGTRAFGITPTARIFIATGMLGGYTTFSTFSIDSLNLIESGGPSLTALYALASVGGGVLAAYAGQVLTRMALG